jgi:potassium-transporting ATPase KdpC subunit
MNALRMFIWMTVLTGMIYPLLITAIAHVAMPAKAKGSLVMRNHKIVGSALIGQKFESEHYFWPRPSAVDYNPLPSGGSNLGPTSAELKTSVDKRRTSLAAAFSVNDLNEIPSELLFASGSGLDPHISPKCAYFQIARVAKGRNMEDQKLKALIDSLIHRRTFGFLGEKYINVLELNLALDREEKIDAGRREARS